MRINLIQNINKYSFKSKELKEAPKSPIIKDEEIIIGIDGCEYSNRMREYLRARIEVSLLPWEFDS